MQTPPPRIEFLRNLLPKTFTEEQMQAEEWRLLRFIGLFHRIAKRLEHEKHAAGEERDSTK